MDPREELLAMLADRAIEIVREEISKSSMGLRASTVMLLAAADDLFEQGDPRLEPKALYESLVECDIPLDSSITTSEGIHGRVRERLRPNRKKRIDPVERPRRDGPSRAEQASSPPGLDEIAEQRRDELRAQLRSNREQLTRKLLDYLPTVEGRSFATLEESRAFVREINLMVENAGQRLVDPDSGRPAYLSISNLPSAPPGGYLQFRIDPEQPGGKRRASKAYRVIPPLRLQEL